MITKMTNEDAKKCFDRIEPLVRLDDVIEALDGIDKDESQSMDGWWPNSQGAKFGKQVLAQIKMKSFTAEQRDREKHDS